MSKKGGTPKGGGATGNQSLAGANVVKPIPDLTAGGIVSQSEAEIKINQDPLAEAIIPLDQLPVFMRSLGPEEKAPITQQRWELAQKAEREQHTMSAIEGAIHYGKAYKHYFGLLGLGFNLHGLNVIEVGPADFPALACCDGIGKAVIVEPMPSDILLTTCEERGFILFQEAFEKAFTHVDKINEGITEVWLLNVMQHVIDPEVFINTAKHLGDRIRFFEPIDQPITDYHPHSYSLKDFQRWFGDVNLYVGGSIEGFHQADCVYGIWIK